MLELERNLYVLRRWWWLLVLGALVGGISAFGYTKATATNRYEAVAVVASGATQGERGTYFASGDTGTDGTLLLNAGMFTALQRQVPGISRGQLTGHLTGTASAQGCVSLNFSGGANQCRLLFLHVQWTDPATTIRLANAVAAVYMQQERIRLEEIYALDQRTRAAQEQTLASLIRATPGKGAAQNWLQAQYANALSNLYDADASSRIQTSIGETSLRLAQPARSAGRVTASKTTTLAALGALVGLIVAWVIAFLATSSYGSTEEMSGPHPVISRVND